MAVNGIHIENSRIGVGAADRNAIVGRAGCVTMLHGQAGEVYPQIRGDLGAGVLIHIRMYTPNWFALNPQEWAQNTLAFLHGIPGLLDDPRVLITAANEPDLAYEGHPGAATPERTWPALSVWKEIWNWSGAFSSEWRRIAKGTKVKLGTTPLAGGHEPLGFPPDYEYQMLEFRQHAADCDAIVAHGYTERNYLGHTPTNGGYWAALRCIRPMGYREREGLAPVAGIPDPGGVAIQLPGKPFLLSEFGNWHHSDADAASVEATLNQFRNVYKHLSASGRCLGVTPFIWNAGDEHRENRIYGNGPLVEGLKRLDRFPAAEFGTAPAQTWYWPLAEMHITQEYSAEHKAVDLRAPTGTPIHAVADGNVSAAFGAKYGNFSLQSLPGGYTALCAHLQGVTKTGRVVAGEQIAIADATGECDPAGAAHVHFEIRGENQERYDPMLFMRERGAILPGGGHVPGERPLSEQYPAEFAAWAAAGGIESNFARHLRAIRSDIPIKGMDVLDAIGGAKSAAEQTALIAARYKFT